MLNFKELMKRISYLAEHTSAHAQNGEFKPAAEDLMLIAKHTSEAMHQLEDMSKQAYYGRLPAKR